MEELGLKRGIFDCKVYHLVPLSKATPVAGFMPSIQQVLKELGEKAFSVEVPEGPKTAR